jgi:nitroreductase
VPEDIRKIAMQYEDFLGLVKARRSIRHYKPDPVVDGDIEKIIEAARWAPSGFNSQLWEFVVVKDPGLKGQIAEVVGTTFSEIVKSIPPPERRDDVSGKRAVFGWEKAPVFIIVFGDTRVRALSPVPPVRTSDEKWTSVFISSLAIAVQHAALAATSLGLGSQWVSAVGIPSVAGKIREILGIPPEIKIYDMMALGYPSTEPPPKTMRPRKEMIHYDACGGDDFRTDDEVRAFFGK